MTNPTISILTATYNAEKHLPGLIASLAAQTDPDFEWVVADGGSTDGTLTLVESARQFLSNITLLTEQDCGIYYAFNKAIQTIKSNYYLVAGADDIFYPNAIEEYKKAIKYNNSEFISAKVIINGKIISYKKPKWIFLYGPSAYVSSHSIGLAIKIDTHKKIGMYDTTYRIYSDSHFMLKAIKKGTTIVNLDFIAGEFSANGISNSNHIESYCEQFRAQIETGSNFIIQLLLLGARVTKYKLQFKHRR